MKGPDLIILATQNKLPNSKISFSENKRLIATQYKYYKCSIQNEYLEREKHNNINPPYQ
jgi:hypothetical protein